MILKHQITATQLRLILIISMFLIAVLAAVGFSFVNSSLKSFAIEVSRVAADAEAGRNNVQSLQQVQKQLEKDADIVQKTNSIVAESQSYQYQDQIITDINNYASRAGIAITDINFAAIAQSGSSAGGSTQTPAAPLPSGLKSSPISITLKNPVNYNNLLKFIKSIEQNLTKMQVARVNLSKDSSNGAVNSDALTLQVYVR